MKTILASDSDVQRCIGPWAYVYAWPGDPIHYGGLFGQRPGRRARARARKQGALYVIRIAVKDTAAWTRAAWSKQYGP